MAAILGNDNDHKHALIEDTQTNKKSKAVRFEIKLVNQRRDLV